MEREEITEKCPRCGEKLYKSQDLEKPFYCRECKENFYTFECMGVIVCTNKLM